MDERKISYLVASIMDIQSTIRAIDTKIGVLIAFLIFPISNLDKIYTHLAKIAALNLYSINYILILMFIAIWIFSLVVIFKAISALDNPSNHVTGRDTVAPKGSFYVGGAFNLRISDLLFNRSSVKSNRELADYVEMLPTDDNGLVEELTFEQLKLVYIRDIKMHRFNTGLKLAYTWLVLGFIIYIISKLSQ